MNNLDLDSSPCLLFSFGDDGRIRNCNQTMCTTLGYTNEELNELSVENLLTISTRIFFQTHFIPMVRMQGQAQEIYFTLKTKNGEQLPVLVCAARKQDADGYITECAGIVIQQRKQFEEELIAAKRLAEESLLENKTLLEAQQLLREQSIHLDRQMQEIARRSEESRQINKALTHDLQEPVRKIKFLVNQINAQSAETLSDDFHKLITRMSAACSTLQSTLSALQQYIWIDDVQDNTGTVNLNHVMLVAQQRVEKEESVILSITRQDIPHVNGDADQLTKLFYQLFKNAVQYRKPGTEARISISATVISENRFRLQSNRYSFEEVLKIEVKDEGTGFDPAYNEEIFQLFKRMNANSRRSMGLALCRKIIDNHQGTIKAEGIPGVGVRVMITLPSVISKQGF